MWFWQWKGGDRKEQKHRLRPWQPGLLATPRQFADKHPRTA